MKNLISVAVILHVAFTAAGLKLNGKEVEFGDIIAFEPQCQAGVNYQHYAVYVGDEYGDDNTTFERLKKSILNTNCNFPPINMSRNPYVFNFLDGYKAKNGRIYTKGSKSEIRGRIEAKKDSCGLYNLFCNNCEHLATYVRYGEKISIQFNMTGEIGCKISPFKSHREMWKYVKEMND